MEEQKQLLQVFQCALLQGTHFQLQQHLKLDTLINNYNVFLHRLKTVELC